MSNSQCLIIAGEKSGEDHAMTFFPELKKLVPGTKFFGVGGDKLKKEDVEILYHTKEFSSVGITEVLGKLRFYFKAMDHIIDEVKKRKCKTAILVDFQGFNLKLAKKLKKMNVEVLYYVAPQAWVWKPWRAKAIEKNVHTLFTILPFEKKWFQDRGVKKIKGVVHPLKVEYGQAIETIRKRDFSDFQNRNIRLLLLPGSRRPEVEALFPIFLKAIELLKEEGFKLDIGLVQVETVDAKNYEAKDLNFFKKWDSHELESAFDWADLCFASSGTVTLATGLFQLPTVVAYKVSLINEFILKMLIPYKGPASLTNIILDDMVFPEVLQYEADRYNLAKYARSLLTDKDLYNDTIEKLSKTNGLISGDDFSTAEYMAKVISR
jgi:lipid-A-disaccharide synthase